MTRSSLQEISARLKLGIALYVLVDSALARNAASLYMIQFANYLLPLITIPYLVRVLGPLNYGAVAFAQSLIGYLMVFVDYGFDLSATRKISVHRDDPTAISYIAVNTWAAKGLLCICGFLILAIVTLLVPQVRETWKLVFILYGLVIGNVLFPVWLFQGMEQMVVISVINLITRLLVVVGMFLAVRHPEDHVIYAGLLSLGAIIAGGIGMAAAARTFKLKITLPSFRAVWQALTEGWLLFIATTAGNVYVLGNSFILGLFGGHAAVGYYNAAERIVRSVVGILGPFVRATYPRSSRIASRSGDLTVAWAGTLLLMVGAVGLVLSLVLLLGAPLIVQLFLGVDYDRSITVIRILSPLPLLIGISYILGPQIILPLSMDRVFTLILLFAAVLDVGLSIVTAPLWGEVGVSLALLATETFVTAAMLTYLHRVGIRLRRASKHSATEDKGNINRSRDVTHPGREP